MIAPTLCIKCPAKIHLGMKVNTGVKKAIAVRLRIMVEMEIKDLQFTRNNLYFQKTLTATQRTNYERRCRKRINALRIVIAICEDRCGELPSMYGMIPTEKGPE